MDIIGGVDFDTYAACEVYGNIVYALKKWNKK